VAICATFAKIIELQTNKHPKAAKQWQEHQCH
jgi:hypothetical protein